MRVAVPSLRIGKRGGYRLVYRVEHIDELVYVVLLNVYFKGDKPDLSEAEYSVVEQDAEEILASPLNYSWTDPPRP